MRNLILLAVVLLAPFAYGAKYFDDVRVSDSMAVGTVSAADTSAALEVRSTSKGFLLPRMNTAQRDAIASPVEGLLLFNTDTDTLDYYNAGSFDSLSAASFAGTIDLTSEVTGVLPVANGGTDRSSWVDGVPLVTSNVFSSISYPFSLGADVVGSISTASLAGTIDLSSQVNGSLPVTALSGIIALAQIPSVPFSSHVSEQVPVNRIAAQTANRAATFDGSGFLAPSIVTVTELSYVSGATTNLQAQIDALVAGGGITQLTGDVLAGPGGGSQAATVAFVGGVTAASIASTITDVIDGISTASLSGTINLASQVSGVLPVANGGTNRSSWVDGLVRVSSNVLSTISYPLSFGTDVVGSISTASLSGTINLASQVSGVLPVANGGTDKSSWVDGVVRVNSNVLSTLSYPFTLGADVVGSISTASLSGTINLLTQTGNLGAKGALLTTNGTNNVSFPVGTDGYVLTASSGSTNGLAWAAQSGGGGGDVVTDGTSIKLCYGFFNNVANDVTTDPTNCVASITDNGAGDITVNFTGSYFSGNVMCTCNAVSGGTDGALCQIAATGATSHRFKIFDVYAASSTLLDISFSFSCFGLP